MLGRQAGAGTDGADVLRGEWSALRNVLSDVEAALQGAKDIIAETVSENEQSRNQIRGEFRRGAIITSKVVAKKKDEEDAQRFSDYFDFSEPLKRCSSHRLLAMRRGEAAGFLRVSISADEETCITKLKRHYVHGFGECQTLVGEAVDDAFKRLLKPSIETEFAAQSKQKADEEAIVVFAENLRQLLLAAPLGQKRVMAVDPGFANGCKTACLDAQGNLVHHEIVYPHPPRSKRMEATAAMKRMVRYGARLSSEGQREIPAMLEAHWKKIHANPSLVPTGTPWEPALAQATIREHCGASFIVHVAPRYCPSSILHLGC